MWTEGAVAALPSVTWLGTFIAVFNVLGQLPTVETDISEESVSATSASIRQG